MQWAEPISKAKCTVLYYTHQGFLQRPIICFRPAPDQFAGSNTHCSSTLRKRSYVHTLLLSTTTAGIIGTVLYLAHKGLCDRCKGFRGCQVDLVYTKLPLFPGLGLRQRFNPASDTSGLYQFRDRRYRRKRRLCTEQHQQSASAVRSLSTLCARCVDCDQQSWWGQRWWSRRVKQPS